jgi:hypothetical protein
MKTLWYRYQRQNRTRKQKYTEVVTSVADPCLRLMDPDPDPLIFVIDL